MRHSFWGAHMVAKSAEGIVFWLIFVQGTDKMKTAYALNENVVRSDLLVCWSRNGPGLGFGSPREAGKSAS